jgi:hypothetical protein
MPTAAHVHDCFLCGEPYNCVLTNGSGGPCDLVKEDQVCDDCERDLSNEAFDEADDMDDYYSDDPDDHNEGFY